MGDNIGTGFIERDFPPANCLLNSVPGMNKLRQLLALLFLTIIPFRLAADSVTISFVSLSPQIVPGTGDDPLHGLQWTSSLSSFGNPNSINHELMLSTGGHAFSHEGNFILQDPFAVEPYIIPFVLDVPPQQDANDNGVDDFFDLDMPVDGGQTLGRHPDGEGGGADFFATWFRPAGDAVGSVVIEFPFFDGLRFEHFFQLLHYRGDFVYERDGTDRQGTLSITNVVDPADWMAGPLTLEVVTTNRLHYAATNWTSGSGLDYVTLTNFSVGRSGTNFVAFWTLEDGYFGSGEQDYVDWAMVVHGTDANGNGQIDLVEDASAPPEEPRLQLVRTPDGLLELTIEGTPGETYALESTDILPTGSWTIAQVITLSASVQTISTANTGDRRFFRLRVQ